MHIERINLRTYNSWLRIDHDQPRLYTRIVSAELKEREEGVVAGLGHETSVRKNAMFQAVELPACVCYLHARLSNVYLYDLAPAAHVTPQLYSTFAYSVNSALE